MPKVEAPSTIKDYRPIYCCNVPYKCITKILANRMQPVLSGLIYPCQSVFVKGRMFFCLCKSWLGIIIGLKALLGVP